MNVIKFNEHCTHIKQQQLPTLVPTSPCYTVCKDEIASYNSSCKVSFRRRHTVNDLRALCSQTH